MCSVCVLCTAGGDSEVYELCLAPSPDADRCDVRARLMSTSGALTGLHLALQPTNEQIDRVLFAVGLCVCPLGEGGDVKLEGAVRASPPPYPSYSNEQIDVLFAGTRKDESVCVSSGCAITSKVEQRL
jgi:hypothetical protein